jgi:ribosomal protein S12 methylthiotransferase accessory factor
VKSVQETLSDVIPLCTRIGITRISDITLLDRLRVPNYSAILPGTKDSIWVYSGKGVTRAQAKASAIMESIERYSSLPSSYCGTFIHGSYSHVLKSYSNVLHPKEVVEAVNRDYDETKTILNFVKGVDLFRDEEILVPADVALYPYEPKDPVRRIFTSVHTNGLASGNVMEEAICHALCEVIERDAVSIADLCASSIPYTILETMGNSLRSVTSIGTPIEDKFIDDPNIFPVVDISEVAEEFEPIMLLVQKFADAHIPLLIKDITPKDIGIPTFLASSIEWLTHDYGYFAKGFGTHPDARIALIRAITECSQTRAVNIQGARDDLQKIKYKEKDEIYERKWPFMPVPGLSIVAGNASKKIKFSEIKSYSNEDILDDIKVLLSSLKKGRLKRAIIVDLTCLNVGIPVVRAIVPGLETFEVTHSVMGTRAKEHFWANIEQNH